MWTLVFPGLFFKCSSGFLPPPPQQFKSEAYQQQIEMERLNHQAELLLKKVTEEADKHTVQDPLMELKLIWDSLDERIVSRQVNTKTVM